MQPKYYIRNLTKIPANSIQHPADVDNVFTNLKILLVLLFVLFSIPQLAQHSQNETLNSSPGENSFWYDSIVENQTNYIQELYYDTMNLSNEILNGRAYNYYFYPHISSPLIPEQPKPTASIIIRNQEFENVMLQYDTYKGLVVYFDPNNLINSAICPITINKDIIDEFTLQLPSGISKFIYLELPGGLKGKLRSGFYEIVYDEYCQFIIKHSSQKITKEGRDTYPYVTDRYIMNAGTYYRVRGKGSLLKALGDKADEVKKFVKASKIQVRRADKHQIENILKYYNSLLEP